MAVCCTMEQLKTEALFDLNHTATAPLLSRFAFPWEALPHIGAFIKAWGAELPSDAYRQVGEQIWVHRDATIAESALLTGPCVIMAGAEVRTGAYLRGNVVVGEHCVVGNSTELKNTILFDHVQVPHYNYVGDSILGYRAHMGAGSITSNVRSDKKPVVISGVEPRVETGLRKFGAMIGDHVEIGCNAVLNPGTVIGRGSSVYPLCLVRGAVPPNSICKTPSADIVQRADAE